LARTRAVSSIHTVTRTMEMVATARFKRAHRRCVNARSYITGCRGLVDELVSKCSRQVLRHRLLRSRTRTADRVLCVMTSDRGLCGGYNQAILRLVSAYMKQHQGETVSVFVAGKRGAIGLRRMGISMAEEHRAFDSATEGHQWRLVTELADTWMAQFADREIAGVDIAYGKLRGAGHQEAVIEPLLPLIVEERPPDQVREFDEYAEVPLSEPVDENAETDDWAPYGKAEPYPPYAPYASNDPPDKFDSVQGYDPATPVQAPEFEYEFVPSPRELLDELLPMTVRLTLFECFLESAVTEQIARMAAMRAATDAGQDMIEELNTQYNRSRQGQITTELAEILGGTAAME
jgi:F-type H+-transporting ATPase subunit gamma